MRVPRKRLTQLIAFVVDRQRADVAEVDVAVVDRETIAQLNRQYLGHRGETDVLSFDLSDTTRARLVAQIVVCGDVAVEQARRHGSGRQRELMLYVVHGLLHLTGHDDTTPHDAARMHAREDELLTEFRQLAVR